MYHYLTHQQGVPAGMAEALRQQMKEALPEGQLGLADNLFGVLSLTLPAKETQTWFELLRELLDLRTRDCSLFYELSMSLASSSILHRNLESLYKGLIEQPQVELTKSDVTVLFILASRHHVLSGKYEVKIQAEGMV
jgi:hypothetical protein